MICISSEIREKKKQLSRDLKALNIIWHELEGDEKNKNRYSRNICTVATRIDRIVLRKVR